MRRIGWLVVIATLLVCVYCQSSTELTIRIVTEDNRYSLETKLSLAFSNVLFLSICRAEGNNALVRINPSDSDSEIMDEKQGLSNDTKGVMSCMFPDQENHVTCKNSDHFCELNNDCVAEIKSSCSPNNLRTMHYVDVTLRTENSHLIVDNCMALCEEEGYQQEDTDSEGNGISNLAIGLIIAGVILVAALLVAGAVIWKLRDSVSVRERHHKGHHMQYAK